MNPRTAIAVLVSVASGLLALASTPCIAEAPVASDASKVDLQWSVKIPMRDGIRLSATVYTPKSQKAPAPCIFTLTPYIAQSYHDRGLYFAARGLPFLTVDVRGRGNSEGQFRPFIQEAHDGYDVVEWLAKQPYCNGKVSMWGGSYSGYDQWATAKERPPHLATLVPAAAVYPGFDFPMSNNMTYPYVMTWLTFTSGRASQEKLFGDGDFWAARFRETFERGLPFAQLDQQVGNSSAVFQEWVAHPMRDRYWDAHVPSAAQYAALDMPILTITGSHDSDQTGALAFYREHIQHASAQGRSRHYLVVGPWDHAGTRTPQAEFGGLKFGPASLVDLPKLHREWYAWTMEGGPKPEFLAKPVAYYVMGAERWRFAETLEEVAARKEAFMLDSTVNADDVFTAGTLTPGKIGTGKPDQYLYDPRDTGSAERESADESGGYVSQWSVVSGRGVQLVYHSAPFEAATQISGRFALSAWLAIDQPDTDFSATVYEIGVNGDSIQLASDSIRARHRESLREAKLITTREPLRYDFNQFTFVAREVKRGSRLRLVIGPINSMNAQKNYNSGGVVSKESMQDARVVTVRLFHDEAHPSALHVPYGAPQSADEPVVPPSYFTSPDTDRS